MKNTYYLKIFDSLLVKSSNLEVGKSIGEGMIQYFHMIAIYSFT